MKKPNSLDVKKFNRTFTKGLVTRLDYLLQYEELMLRQFEKKTSGSRHLNATAFVKVRNKKLRLLKAIQMLIDQYKDVGVCAASVLKSKGGRNA
ncbi:hypothetical protein D3C71_50620 [compost metagenome]